MIAPKEIFLQVDEDGEKAIEWLDGSTWAANRINKSDVRYIRADLPDVSQPENSADKGKPCEFCGETSCKNAECEDDY